MGANTATAGGNGGGGFPGGTSGAPQSKPGGGAGQPAGGGGGAGGSGSKPGGGAALQSFIRTSTGEFFGAGGGGQSSRGEGGGGGGSGIPGGSNGIIVRVNDTTTSGVGMGGSLSYVTTFDGSALVYTVSSSDRSIQTPTSVGYQWTTDSPTPTGTNTGVGDEVSGNYAILDVNRANISPSNGATTYNVGTGSILSTLSIAGGKYYFEVTPATASIAAGRVGVAKTSIANASLTSNPGSSSDAYVFDLSTGKVVNNGASSNYGNSLTVNQTLGVAFDADLGKIYFAINNTWQNGGNPVTDLNPAFSNLLAGPYNLIFGGQASGTLSVNFGSRAYTYTAPTGYGPFVENPTQITLTLTDSTSLNDITPGDQVIEGGSGDAAGVVTSVNSASNQLTVGSTTGTWTVGSTVIDTSRQLPLPAPTTEPPNPLDYTLIASSINSTVNLTSYPVGKPPLDPLTSYYARVRYKSNAIVTETPWSSYSLFTTGTLA